MTDPAAPSDAMRGDLANALEAMTGHRFIDLARLELALTHASARSQSGRDYERLEFLGDRVLGLCVAEMLFAAFPDADQGELSVRLNALVNADTLAQVADDMGVTGLIRTGSDMRDLADARLKNVRADVVEALIACIYLDGGTEASCRFITRYWGQRARSVTAGRRDAKTELQEWTHKTHGETPRYTVIDRRGPDHEPSFTVQVTIDHLPPEQATGRSKRQAEQMAAEQFLVREQIWAADAAGAS